MTPGFAPCVTALVSRIEPAAARNSARSQWAESTMPR